jgi:hypothetical protein
MTEAPMEGDRSYPELVAGFVIGLSILVGLIVVAVLL